MAFLDKLKAGLQKTKNALFAPIDQMLKAFTKVDEDLLEELEEMLICADVGAGATDEIIENLRESIKEEKIPDAAGVRAYLKQTLKEMIGEGEELNLSTTPAVILVIGVNGAGKTTSIGKISNRLISKGKTMLEESFSPLFSSNSIIDEIFGLPTVGGKKTKKCEGCGATWQEVSKLGRAGCALCYGTFENELEHSIRSIHGNVTHVGRRPAVSGKRPAPAKRENLVDDLKKALQAAIESENFEEAARLRDEIRASSGKKGE